MARQALHQIQHCSSLLAGSPLCGSACSRALPAVMPRGFGVCLWLSLGQGAQQQRVSCALSRGWLCPPAPALSAGLF